jgi:hypothetical protein
MNQLCLPEDMLITGNPQTDTFISDWTMMEEYEARLVPNWSLPHWKRWVTHVELEQPVITSPRPPANGWVNQGTASDYLRDNRTVAEFLKFANWEKMIYESLQRARQSISAEDSAKAYAELTAFVDERLHRVTDAVLSDLRSALYREQIL